MYICLCLCPHVDAASQSRACVGQQRCVFACGLMTVSVSVHHSALYLFFTPQSAVFSNPSVDLEFRDVSLAAGVLSSQKWMLRPSDVIGSGISSTASAVTSAAAAAAAAAAATANVVVTAMQSEAVATGMTVVGTGVAGMSHLEPFIHRWFVNLQTALASGVTTTLDAASGLALDFFSKVMMMATTMQTLC